MLFVYAHSILLFPESRKDSMMSYTGNGVKIPNFPIRQDQLNSCLGSNPTVPSAQNTFTSGQTITVKWAIPIDHTSDPGVRIAYQVPGGQMTVIKEGIDVHTLQASVPLPKVTGNVVLQYIWASQADGGFYMACADLNLKASASSSPSSTPSTTSSNQTTTAATSNAPVKPQSSPVQSSASQIFWILPLFVFAL